MSQLLVIYQHDGEICEKLLDALIKAFDADDRNKDIVAYILLENLSNSTIAEKMNARPELKQQCEKIAKEKVDLIMNFDISVNGLNEKFIIGLLNGCLPNSSLCKDKMVYLLRSMSSWMLRKQASPFTNDEKNAMIVVTSLIPLIEKKLRSAGIHDDYIVETLHEIRRSEWFKTTFFKTYRSIKIKLEDEDDELQQAYIDTKGLSMMYTYYEEMRLYRREKLYFIIQQRKSELKMCLDSDYKILSLVLYASPMQKSNPEDTIVYKLAAMVCLCAGQFWGKVGV